MVGIKIDPPTWLNIFSTFAAMKRKLGIIASVHFYNSVFSVMASIIPNTTIIN